MGIARFLCSAACSITVVAARLNPQSASSAGRRLVDRYCYAARGEPLVASNQAPYDDTSEVKLRVISSLAKPGYFGPRLSVQ